MAILDVNFSPSSRQLRQFGLVCLAALPLIAWLWTRSLPAVGWAGGAGLLLCVAGFVAPQVLKPVFLGLTLITLPIGLVVGELTMLLLYFGLFLPMALVFRLTGRDSLMRRHRADAETFWNERQSPRNVRNYYHQF